MCVPAPSGIRSWLSPAMHFGVVSDSCELLLSALPCRTAAIAAAASAATWAKPCSIFTRHLVDVAKSKKGPLLVFCPYSLICVIYRKKAILHCFWNAINCWEVPKNDKRVQLFRIISALFCIVFAAALLLQILLMCNLMYIRRQTEMCCAHVLNMLKLTDHG